MLYTIEHESFYEIVKHDDDKLFHIKNELLDKYEQLKTLFDKIRKLQAMSEQQRQHYASSFQEPMTTLIARITDLEMKREAFIEKIQNPKKLTQQQKRIARKLGWIEKKGLLTPEQKKTVGKNFRTLGLQSHPDKDKTKTQEFTKFNNVKQILLNEYIDL